MMNKISETKTIEEDGLVISEDRKVLLGVCDSSIMSINIPDGIEVVGEDAFNGCGLLREVHLPKTVKSIGISAFQECKYLNKINLPDGLKEIGDWAFFLLHFPELRSYSTNSYEDW